MTSALALVRVRAIQIGAGVKFANISAYNFASLPTHPGTETLVAGIAYLRLPVHLLDPVSAGRRN
ncbi:hypothetical protein, partial [Roseibium sp.]|uniref:hypothetical protein n=1 Tax=Roseibium sp. TaxID=1936156 RepID=UPI0025DEE7A1